MIVVVPTSSIAPEIWPLRVAMGSFAGKDSQAVIPGIRQVTKGRLRGALGQLSHEQLTLLDECLDACCVEGDRASPRAVGFGDPAQQQIYCFGRLADVRWMMPIRSAGV